MFSPILATVSAIASAIVMPPTLAALIASTSVPTSSATSAIIRTKPWNRSLRATKSVSELTSTTTPFLPLTAAPVRPSAATRPAFLAAFARPFLRSQSTAASMLPSFSPSAALQSIMPAPVASRSSLTICAEMLAIEVVLLFAYGRAQPGSSLCQQARTMAAAVQGACERAEAYPSASAVSSFDFAIQPSTRPGNPTSSPILCAASGPSPAICQ